MPMTRFYNFKQGGDIINFHTNIRGQLLLAKYLVKELDTVMAAKGNTSGSLATSCIDNLRFFAMSDLLPVTKTIFEFSSVWYFR